MVGEDVFIFPAEFQIIPLREIPKGMIPSEELPESTLVVTRNREKFPERVVDADEAALLAEFRTPATMADALMNFSKRHSDQRNSFLNQGVAFLRAVQRIGLLRDAVPAALHISHRFVPGEIINGETLVEARQMSGCVLCKMRNEEGKRSAFKIGQRDGFSRLNHEANILSRLEGLPVPTVLGTGNWLGRPYLHLTWCQGMPLLDIQLERNGQKSTAGSMTAFDRIDLAYRVIQLYTEVHSRGVVHGEVHLKNLFVDTDGSIRLVDFSHAHRPGVVEGNPRVAGDYSYYAPDFVLGMIRGTGTRLPDFADEQYAIASMVYHILTGARLSQENAAPREMTVFSRASAGTAGFLSSTSVSKMLSRALSLHKELRYPSMRDFGASLKVGGPIPFGASGPTPRPH